MYQFFVNPSELNNSPVRITGEDYNHMKNVLRLKKGEKIQLSDGEGHEYICIVSEYDTESSSVLLEIEDMFGSAGELPARITLFQGYPKGDKMETIVQKAVELGVCEIVPVMMKRSIVKLDAKKAEKKVERLNSIALSAAKQSKRGVIPEVKPVMTMQEALQYAKTMEYTLLPYEQAEGMEYSRCILQGAKDKRSIAIFVGPEGGFEQTEVDAIESIGGKTMSLGHRILRTETAGMTILSLLMFLLEED